MIEPPLLKLDFVYFDLIHFYTASTAPLCSEDKKGSDSVATPECSSVSPWGIYNFIPCIVYAIRRAYTLGWRVVPPWSNGQSYPKRALSLWMKVDNYA